ncbi:MAG: YggS family pyridoxal phosphate-dependent enzyme [Methylotenera sp.]|nr:YggS family pyridoxal phosphate-dependent enzyme [Oligoflexia bacterium]
MSFNESLQRNYQSIRDRIVKAAGSPEAAEKITLIAVTKTQPIEAIEELHRLGHRDFGENYVQEMVEKATTLSARGLSGIRWHFIGHLQTNKVKNVLPYAHAIHAVDSEKLAREIARQAQKFNIGPIPVFVSVNLHYETTKTGFKPDELEKFTALIASFPELKILGLMCIPSPAGNVARSFADLRELEKDCRPSTQGALSMGMTQDFEEGIRQGSTHIRVGTALFGERPPKTPTPPPLQ